LDLRSGYRPGWFGSQTRREYHPCHRSANPVSDDVYFIVPDKCTECEGFHEEPQCAAVCPVDCCVPDPDRRESTETLLDRKQYLHDQANP